MFEQHLAPPRIDEIRQTILDVLGYDPPTRAALLSALPSSYRALLPGNAAAPLIALQLDLSRMNTTRRLTDGTVPLKVFLTTALSLGGNVEGTDVLRAAAAEVESASSGAPPIAPEPIDTQEKIIARNDMVPLGFLSGGLTAARAVARLLVPRHENGTVKTAANGDPVNYRGTGWLLARDVLITNHHVINAREHGEPGAAAADFDLQAMGTCVEFDYDGDLTEATPVSVTGVVAADPGLDYAVLRLAGDGRDPLTISATVLADVKPGDAVAVNIIQHPDGNPKKLGIRNNLVAAATATELRYYTDTLFGSSGSPVLDDNWQVVGLHRGSAFVQGVSFQGQEVAYVNVGSQVGAILDHLREHHPGSLPEIGV